MYITNDFVKQELAIRTKIYGKLIDAYKKRENPKPFTSLLLLLEKNGIKPKYMKLMAYDLNKAYEYFKNLDIKAPKLNVEIYAYGEEEKELNIGNANIKFIPIKNKLETHINLIYDENDDLYVYYEPFHKDIYDFDINFEKASENELLIHRPELRKPNIKQKNEVQSTFDFYVGY
ncbi:MAG: hypothetical protein GXO62_03380 [Epsilonproteobacteria bacterium]|nr:hypothetical protein [Campylobacterota bacterium]